MRLIDADAMRQDWLENGENEYIYDTNAVLDSIDAQLTVSRWIPVTERLPEVGEEFVLVCVNGRYHNIKFAGAAEIAMYDEDGWWIEAYPEWKNPRVTHWMPLPDAPKE